MDTDERIKQLEDRVRALEDYIAGPVLGGTAQKLVGSSLEIANEQGEVVATLKPAPGGASLIIGNAQAKGSVIIGRSEDGPHVMLTRRDQQCAAMFCTDEDDLAQLMFAGEQPKPKITLGTSKACSDLCLRDDEGRPRLALNVLKDGTPSILLYDENNEVRVKLHSIDGGSTAFTLYDAKGKSCAQLCLKKDGTPMLLLNSGQDDRAVAMTVEKDTQGIRIFDAAGHARILIVSDKDGNSHLMMANEEDKVRVALGVDDEQSGLRVYDSHEKGRLLVTVDADESPWIIMNDAEQQRRARLSLMLDGTAHFALYDSEGRARATLSAQPKCGGLMISDARGKMRAMLCLYESGPKLILVDEDGEPIHEAP